MERTLSQEERIKRAEELYYRRQNAINANRTTTVNVNPRKNYKLLKKLLVQIIICMGIYSVIYKLQGNSDNFSTDSINYIKSAIAYDSNIDGIFENVKNYLSNFYNLKENNELTNNVVQNEVIEDTLSAAEETSEEAINQEDINKVEENASSISEIDENATYIKNNFSLIKPLTTGTITSRFGLRNPTTETVPKYHTGIDIGVPEGTVYVAAMEGTVSLVSSEGSYRKPCKNNKWRCINHLCTL